MTAHKMAKAKVNRATPSPVIAAPPIEYFPGEHKYYCYGKDFFFDDMVLDGLRRESEPAGDDTAASAALADAAKTVETVVKNIFGPQATIDFRTNSDLDADAVPFLIEARYGLDHEPTDDDWLRHADLLRTYVASVPANVRRQIRLVRTVA